MKIRFDKIFSNTLKVIDYFTYYSPRNSIIFKSLLVTALFGFFAETSAQTIEQRELADRLGIEINDLSDGFDQPKNGIGEINNNFKLRNNNKIKNEDLKTYLGFSRGYAEVRGATILFR